MYCSAVGLIGNIGNLFPVVLHTRSSYEAAFYDFRGNFHGRVSIFTVYLLDKI